MRVMFSRRFVRGGKAELLGFFTTGEVPNDHVHGSTDRVRQFLGLLDTFTPNDVNLILPN